MGGTKPWGLIHDEKLRGHVYVYVVSCKLVLLATFRIVIMMNRIYNISSFLPVLVGLVYMHHRNPSPDKLTCVCAHALIAKALWFMKKYTLYAPMNSSDKNGHNHNFVLSLAVPRLTSDGQPPPHSRRPPHQYYNCGCNIAQ